MRGALMLDLETAQQANLFIDEGIAIDNKTMIVRPFAQKALIMLCMKCLTCGPVAKQCEGQKRC